MSSSSPEEQVIWGIDRKKGIFKKTVVATMRITNYRVCLGSTCIGLEKLDDIVVMNQRTVADSSYTSIGGIGGSPRIGRGSSTFRTVGDVAFIRQGRLYIVFGQIEDPQGVARLANTARKTLTEKINTAEKMKKAQLQQKQQQQKERSSSRTTTITSNKVTTCPRCNSTNAQGSKYCNNCGFRIADVAREEEQEVTTLNQRPLSPSSPSTASSPSSSSPSSLIETAEQNVDKFITWKSSAHGVKINYPSNWRVEKGKQPSTLVLLKSPKESPHDMIFENVAIGLHNITKGTRTTCAAVHQPAKKEIP